MEDKRKERLASLQIFASETIPMVFYDDVGPQLQYPPMACPLRAVATKSFKQTRN